VGLTEFWTPEQEAYLVAHPTDYDGFNAVWPLDRSRWRSKRNRLVGPQQHLVPMIVGDEVVGMQTVREYATDEEWEDYFASLIDADEQSAGLSSSQDTTEWHAPDALPVGIALTGDWHCGSRGVLYRKLDDTLDCIRETPGLFAIGMGDYHEGVGIHSKAAPALYSGLFNSGDEQERYVRMRLQRARGKWLALLSGNHDEWCYRHAGLTRVVGMAQEIGVPHFGEGGGTVYVHVGGARWAIGVRHNHAGNSRLNTTNSQRRMFDEWPQWDNLHVAAIAHFHFNDLAISSRKGERVVYIRAGTSKVHDPYAKAGGFTPEWGTPLVVCYPDRPPIAFRGDDFADGVRFLAAERLRYADTVIQSGRH
jgi:hypothetical protein